MSYIIQCMLYLLTMHRETASIVNVAPHELYYTVYDISTNNIADRETVSAGIISDIHLRDHRDFSVVGPIISPAEGNDIL